MSQVKGNKGSVCQRFLADVRAGGSTLERRPEGGRNVFGAPYIAQRLDGLVTLGAKRIHFGKGTEI